MHLTEEQVQRWVHGEEQDPALGRHLGDCPSCQALVDRARGEEGEIFQLLKSVDQEPSDLNAETLIAVGRSRRRPVRYRWAAVLFLIAALTGVAYAIPGSPLRAWIEAIYSADRAETEQVAPSPEPAPETEAAGIAVDPGERLAIVFGAPPAGARVRIVLTDATQVTVQAATGQARFTSGTDQLLVSLSGDSTRVNIQIPRTAPRIDILVGVRRIWTKTGPGIVAPSPSGPDSAYALPLVP